MIIDLSNNRKKYIYSNDIFIYNIFVLLLFLNYDDFDEFL